MAKSKVQLTEQQRQRNAQILARLEAERKWLYEDTRALQQQWKNSSSRRRSRQGGSGDDSTGGD